MFGSTDDAANVAQAVAVQQQSERTVLTEFGDKFDDFSTSPSADLLKKDEVDMKVNDFQKLMVDQYTGLLGVVKEGFASFGKVAQYPVHESEKGNLENPPQTLNEHTTDAKSYNIVDAAGQSSKLGGNEGAAEESLKVPVCKTNLKYVRKLPSKRNRQPSKVYQSPFVSEFDSGSKDKEVIHSQKKLKYLFEGHNINGPYAEDLFSKFSVWMSAGLYNPHATKKD
ncbi:hypothetical protein T459_08981 [Capsicum annuum]|uniref:Uncharacterized protein n=1 Tax=Capsicum annuum TaxID=4072 RepID=A0A2G2ZY28_CAPAN|nr:hypothetical protein T459_08981 [Capsicum annuum]